MGVVRSSASTSETAVVKQILHLIRRTWWSLRPAEISADEMALVTETLAEEELSLWFCMCRADRSHSVMVARRFTAFEPDAPQDALAGVFLHDVGKTVAGLSVPCASLQRWWVQERSGSRVITIMSELVLSCSERLEVLL